MTGLVEMSIVFGALLAFLLWELVSVNRALRLDAERKREAASDHVEASAAVRVVRGGEPTANAKRE